MWWELWVRRVFTGVGLLLGPRFVRTRALAVWLRTARAYGDRGRTAAATRMAEWAVTIARRMRSAGHACLAGALATYAAELRRSGQQDRSTAALAEAVELFRTVDCSRSPAMVIEQTRVAGLLARNGDHNAAVEMGKVALRRANAGTARSRRRWRHARATALYQRGEQLTDHGRYAEAEELFRSAIEIYRLLMRSRSPGFMLPLSHARSALARVLGAQDRPREALEAAGDESFMAAYDFLRTFSSFQPHLRYSYLWLGMHLAQWCADIGEYRRAKKYADEVIGSYRLLVHHNPDCHWPLAKTLRLRANCLRELDDLDGALEDLDNAAEYWRRVAADATEDGPRMGASDASTSALLDRMRWLSDADASSERLVRAAVRLAPEVESHATLVGDAGNCAWATSVWIAVGDLQRQVNRYGDAYEAYQKAIAFGEEHSRTDPALVEPRIADSHQNAAALLQSLAEMDSEIEEWILEHLRESARLRRVHRDVDPPESVRDLAWVVYRLHSWQVFLERDDSALASVAEAAETYRALFEYAETAAHKEYESWRDEYLNALRHLGRRRFEAGDETGSVAAFDEMSELARRIARDAPGVVHMDLAAGIADMILLQGHRLEPDTAADLAALSVERFGDGDLAGPHAGLHVYAVAASVWLHADAERLDAALSYLPLLRRLTDESSRVVSDELAEEMVASMIDWTAPHVPDIAERWASLKSE